MNPDSYEINFTIPKGATGETGATGPTGPAGTGDGKLQAYGGAYNDGVSSIDIIIPGTYHYLILEKEMPELNVSMDNSNSFFLIEKSGTYEINYGCNYYTSTAAVGTDKTCTFKLQKNDADLPGTIITKTVRSTTDLPVVYDSFFNTIIADFTIGENISLMVTSSEAGVISFPNNFNAVVTLKLIG